MTTTKRNPIRLTTALLLVLLGNSAHAALIYFDPPSKNVLLNQPFSVDLMWDGSGSPVKYIGGFNLFVSYDPGILKYNPADPLFPGTGAPSRSTIDPDGGVDSAGCFYSPGIFCFDQASSGVTELFQISLDLDLVTNQDAKNNIFKLAELSFTAEGLGLPPPTGDFVFTTLELLTDRSTISDQDGLNAIPPPAASAQICVGNCPAIPEPGVLALFGLGLLGLAYGQRWRAP